MSILQKMLVPLVDAMCVKMQVLPDGVTGEEEFEDWGKKVVLIMVYGYIFLVCRFF
jgi:hypothetical protein